MEMDRQSGCRSVRTSRNGHVISYQAANAVASPGDDDRLGAWSGEAEEIVFGGESYSAG